MSQNTEETFCGLTRSELCQFASDLCAVIQAEVGDAGYRGGVYSGNVQRNDDGKIVIGAASEGVLKGDELIYTAPELYWNGKRTPACDVYSVGLLLYYMSEGRLPFESEGCNPRKAQQYRMQGNAFNPPVNAGRRLGEIIGNALAFDKEKRYRNVGEMKIMLDNCMKNLFLSEEPCAEAVFKKDDDDLSEMERMMVSIIENHDDLAEDMPEPEANGEEAVLLPVEIEEQPQENKVEAEAEPETELPEEEEAEEEQEEAEPGSETEAAAGDDSGYLSWEEEKSEEPAPAEDEEIYVSAGADAPEDTEEKLKPVSPDEIKPDLEPVRVKRRRSDVDNFPDITVTTDGVATASKPENIAELRRRQRRPLLFILLLCAILIIAAIVFNALVEVPETYVEPEVTPELEEETLMSEEPEQPEEQEEPEESEEPAEPVPMVSTYEIIQADVSWEEARRLCESRGGHLAVINDTDEYIRITALLEDYNAAYAWIGMHREDGRLVWEKQPGEDTGKAADELFCRWAEGEPSQFDGDIPEDYVLLWNRNGWYYNDCVNDPAAEYDWYRGNIVYICEIETPAD